MQLNATRIPVQRCMKSSSAAKLEHSDVLTLNRRTGGEHCGDCPTSECHGRTAGKLKLRKYAVSPVGEFRNAVGKPGSEMRWDFTTWKDLSTQYIQRWIIMQGVFRGLCSALEVGDCQ